MNLMLHQFVTPCNACLKLITPLQRTIVSTRNSLLQLVTRYNAFPSFATKSVALRSHNCREEIETEGERAEAEQCVVFIFANGQRQGRDRRKRKKGGNNCRSE